MNYTVSAESSLWETQRLLEITFRCSNAVKLKDLRVLVRQRITGGYICKGTETNT